MAAHETTVQESIRHAIEGGENTSQVPGEGFALRADQDTPDFAHQARATLAPAWRNAVTMGSRHMKGSVATASGGPECYTQDQIFARRVDT
jgi:hypothetical protein